MDIKKKKKFHDILLGISPANESFAIASSEKCYLEIGELAPNKEEEKKSALNIPHSSEKPALNEFYKIRKDDPTVDMSYSKSIKGLMDSIAQGECASTPPEAELKVKSCVNQTIVAESQILKEKIREETRGLIVTKSDASTSSGLENAMDSRKKMSLPININNEVLCKNEHYEETNYY